MQIITKRLSGSLCRLILWSCNYVYNVSSKILEKYASDNREIFVRATFNNTHKVNGDYIKSFTIDDSISSSNDNLTGIKYEYLPKTEIVVQKHISPTVDKVKVVKTNRIAYSDINVYK